MDSCLRLGRWRLLRGVPEVLGALIRLVLILILAALAGGLVMSVLLAALAFTP